MGRFLGDGFKGAKGAKAAPKKIYKNVFSSKTKSAILKTV